jgi:hypothetical protein
MRRWVSPPIVLDIVSEDHAAEKRRDMVFDGETLEIKVSQLLGT